MKAARLVLRQSVHGPYRRQADAIIEWALLTLAGVGVGGLAVVFLRWWQS